jgi:cell division septum initiation protein DivIVA
MTSKIEQIIDEIEQYIERCKYQPLSNTKIIVVKEDIDELIRELRMKLPDEIQRYRKIISNKEAILNEAKRKAQELIDATTIQTNELVNEHEIMQQAYAQANEVVDLATHQAQEILDAATIEANNIRGAAMQYTDDMLAHLEMLINRTLKTSADYFDNLAFDLNRYSDEIAHNRMELNPPEIEIIDQEILESFADDDEVTVINPDTL